MIRWNTILTFIIANSLSIEYLTTKLYTEGHPEAKSCATDLVKDTSIGRFGQRDI